MRISLLQETFLYGLFAPPRCSGSRCMLCLDGQRRVVSGGRRLRRQEKAG